MWHVMLGLFFKSIGRFSEHVQVNNGEQAATCSFMLPPASFEFALITVQHQVRSLLWWLPLASSFLLKARTRPDSEKC